jgi:phenazine biosynthesis protein phzE
MNALTGPQLLDAILAGERRAFALLRRSDGINNDRLDVLAGRASEHTRLAEIPLEGGQAGSFATGHQLLAFVPYRQIQERGFACPDDGTPILALSVEERASVDLSQALARLPEQRTSFE